MSETKRRWTGSKSTLLKLKKKKKLKVYVAGPLNSSGLATTNVRKAVLAGVELRRIGELPFIPHLFWMAEYLMGFEDEKFWLSWDFDQLRQCDVLVRLPGKSSGSDREVKLAKELDMPVFYGLDAFWEWRVPVPAMTEQTMNAFGYSRVGYASTPPTPTPQERLEAAAALLLQARARGNERVEEQVWKEAVQEGWPVCFSDWPTLSPGLRLELREYHPGQGNTFDPALLTLRMTEAGEPCGTMTVRPSDCRLDTRTELSPRAARALASIPGALVEQTEVAYDPDGMLRNLGDPEKLAKFRAEESVHIDMSKAKYSHLTADTVGGPPPFRGVEPVEDGDEITMWAFYPTTPGGSKTSAGWQLCQFMGLEALKDLPARLSTSCVLMDKLLRMVKWIAVAKHAFDSKSKGDKIFIQYGYEGPQSAVDVQGSGRQDLDDVLRGLLIRVKKEVDERRDDGDKD